MLWELQLTKWNIALWKKCEGVKKKTKEAEKRLKMPVSKSRTGKGSKSGVNWCEKGGLDEEIDQLDPKHIQNTDIDPDKKMGHNWPHKDKLTLVKYFTLEKVWKDMKIKQSDVFQHISIFTVL